MGAYGVGGSVGGESGGEVDRYLPLTLIIYIIFYYAGLWFGSEVSFTSCYCFCGLVVIPYHTYISL